MPNHSPEDLFFKSVDSVQGIELSHVFGDLSQIGTLSEIKQPVKPHQLFVASMKMYQNFQPNTNLLILILF